jgi:hypothetical protein
VIGKKLAVSQIEAAAKEVDRKKGMTFEPAKRSRLCPPRSEPKIPAEVFTSKSMIRACLSGKNNCAASIRKQKQTRPNFVVKEDRYPQLEANPSPKNTKKCK